MRGDTNQKTYKILKRLLRKRFFKCILLSVDKRNSLGNWKSPGNSTKMASVRKQMKHWQN